MHSLLTPIEQVARLTKVEDRDTSDTVLVGAVQQLLGADEVTLLEVLGSAEDARCIIQVSVTAARDEPVLSLEWQSWDEGVPLAGYEGRRLALDSGEPCETSQDGRSALIIPILTGFGRRRLVEIHSSHPLEPTSRALAVGVVTIYRNFLNLLDYSERDTLTTLLNRKSFDDTFYKLLQQRSDPAAGQPLRVERRKPRPLASHWLGVVDIDHFKRVNDGFGHLIGDEVLLLVTRIMRNTFRHDDTLYRFGGEEFVVMLRADDEACAHIAFERLRENVESYVFPQVGQVTISIGYTRLREYDDPSSAFERADKAVYLAKALGRNQVRNYEQQLESGLIQEVAPKSDIDLF